MNKFTAFFKRHRRGIITTTAVLAFDVVMLLVVHPLIANIEDFNTRFFIVVPLAFVIYPAIFLAAGIYTGRDLKRRWHIAVLQVLFCIIGEIKFPYGWLMFIAIELLSLIITLIIINTSVHQSPQARYNHHSLRACGEPCGNASHSGSDSWERSIDCGHAGLYRAVLRGRPSILPCRRDFCRVGFTPQVVHRAVPAARVPDFDRRGFRL